MNINDIDLLFAIKHKMFKNYIYDIENKTKEDIINKFNKNISKRIKLFEKKKRELLIKLKKTKKITKAKKEQIQKQISIIDYNINYLSSKKPYLDKESVYKDFEYYIKLYEIHLRTKNNKKKRGRPKKINPDTLNYLKEFETKKLDEVEDRFGFYIIEMIDNLAKKSNFYNYTYIEEMKSLATQRILLYINNFDEKILSIKTGKQSKPFAYITQIIKTAFIFLINKENKEQNDFLEYNNIINKKNDYIEYEEKVNHFIIKKDYEKLAKDVIKLNEIINHNDFIRKQLSTTTNEDEYNYYLSNIKDVENISSDILDFYNKTNKKIDKLIFYVNKNRKNIISNEIKELLFKNNIEYEIKYKG